MQGHLSIRVTIFYSVAGAALARSHELCSWQCVTESLKERIHNITRNKPFSQVCQVVRIELRHTQDVLSGQQRYICRGSQPNSQEQPELAIIAEQHSNR
jgi:hypothetical protein